MNRSRPVTYLFDYPIMMNPDKAIKLLRELVARDVHPVKRYYTPLAGRYMLTFAHPAAPPTVEFEAVFLPDDLRKSMHLQSDLCQFPSDWLTCQVGPDSTDTAHAYGLIDQEEANKVVVTAAIWQ